MSPNAPPETMSDLERVIRNVEKNSVIVGDFNLTGIDWATGTVPARSSLFVEAVDDAMLTQMVKGNRLDLVLHLGWRGPGRSSLDRERDGVQDEGMERQRTLTLPERPHRGHWQFLYK